MDQYLNMVVHTLLIITTWWIKQETFNLGHLLITAAVEPKIQWFVMFTLIGYNFSVAVCTIWLVMCWCECLFLQMFLFHELSCVLLLCSAPIVFLCSCHSSAHPCPTASFHQSIRRPGVTQWDKQRDGGDEQINQIPGRSWPPYQHTIKLCKCKWACW